MPDYPLHRVLRYVRCAPCQAIYLAAALEVWSDYEI